MCDVQIRKYKHHDEASVLTREIDSWIENCLVEECSDMDIFYSSTLHVRFNRYYRSIPFSYVYVHFDFDFFRRKSLIGLNGIRQ